MTKRDKTQHPKKEPENRWDLEPNNYRHKEKRPLGSNKRRFRYFDSNSQKWVLPLK